MKNQQGRRVYLVMPSESSGSIGSLKPSDQDWVCWEQCKTRRQFQTAVLDLRQAVLETAFPRDSS